jgi:hypothetical protein
LATRIVFIVVALALIVAGFWAYHHDQKLSENASQVTIGAIRAAKAPAAS